MPQRPGQPRSAWGLRQRQTNGGRSSRTSLNEFIAETVGRARTELTFEDAVRVLGVITQGFDREVDGIDGLRSTVFQLSECDRQLELIALGQLPLDFTPAARPVAHSRRTAKSR